MASRPPNWKPKTNNHPTQVENQPGNWGSLAQYRAVQSQHDHHHKEDDGEKRGAHHIRNGFWVSDEEQTRSCKCRIEASGLAWITSHHHFSMHGRPANLYPWRHPPPPPSSSRPCSPAQWRWRTPTRSWSNSWPGWLQWRHWSKEYKRTICLSPSSQPKLLMVSEILHRWSLMTSIQVVPWSSLLFNIWHIIRPLLVFLPITPSADNSVIPRECFRILNDVSLLLLSFLIASAEHTRQGPCLQRAAVFVYPLVFSSFFYLSLHNSMLFIPSQVTPAAVLTHIES